MLQTWTSTGVPLLRLGDRINRFIGFVDVQAGASGSIDVPALSEGSPFVLALSLGDGSSGFLARPSVSGTTVSWTFSNLGYGDPVATRIVYGVF